MGCVERMKTAGINENIMGGQDKNKYLDRLYVLKSLSSKEV